MKFNLYHRLKLKACSTFRNQTKCNLENRPDIEKKQQLLSGNQ